MGETFVFGKYCTYCKILNYIIVHAVGWNEAGGWKEPGSLHQIRQNRHVVSQPARQLFPFAALIFSTFWHIDPAAHQDQCGRCRIQTRDLLCPSCFFHYRERESTGIILPNNFKFTICPQEYIFCFPFYVYFFLHTIFAYISVSVSLNKNTHKKGAFSHLKIIE